MHNEFHSNLVESVKGKATNPLRLSGAILDRFTAALLQYGCDHRAELISTAKVVFDLAAAKCPLPTQVEQAFWNVVLEPALNSVADSACGVDENFRSAASVETDIPPLKFGQGA